MKCQKVRETLPFVETAELNDRLWEIAERFFPRPPINALSVRQPPPFDIDCPVLHQNKAAFEVELAKVQALKNACETFALFLGDLVGRNGDEEQSPARDIEVAIDGEAKKRLDHSAFERVYSVLRALASQQGQTLMTLIIVMDFERAIDQRLQDLEAQRGEYWNLPHRAPNHFARIIALRFAKAIAVNTGKKPTIGTSRDGNRPSTEFGRALDEVFKLLEINADFRRAGQWAVKQLTDTDLMPRRNALADLASFTSGQGTNALADLAALMAPTDKKPE